MPICRPTWTVLPWRSIGGKLTTGTKSVSDFGVTKSEKNSGTDTIAHCCSPYVTQNLECYVFLTCNRDRLHFSSFHINLESWRFYSDGCVCTFSTLKEHAWNFWGKINSTVFIFTWGVWLFFGGFFLMLAFKKINLKICKLNQTISYLLFEITVFRMFLVCFNSYTKV